MIPETTFLYLAESKNVFARRRSVGDSDRDRKPADSIADLVATEAKASVPVIVDPIDPEVSADRVELFHQQRQLTK